MTGPHQGQPNAMRGDHETPRAAMVLLHGRGDSAQGILSLVDHLEAPRWAFVAPQAAGHTWYPNRFVAPLASNEPWLSSALQAVTETLEAIQGAGVPPERTVILGFSQGACLALEFAARTGGRFGGVAALSGGLIGETLDEARYQALEGTPVLIGCSDVDAHIPVGRVHESAALLGTLGASVDKRIYPNFGHSVNEDELEAVRQIMRGVTP